MADKEDEIVQNIKVEIEDDDFAQSLDKLKSAAKDAFESIKDAFNKGDIDFDKIKQEGAKAFEEVKQAGSSAFDFIKGAGTGVVDELKNAFSGLGISMKAALEIGAASFGTFVVAAGFAAKAIFHFVEAQNKITDALGDLSDKTHTSISDVEALEKAYAHGGVSSQEFASGYSKLADVVGRTWDQIKKDTETGVDTLEQKSIAAVKAASALSKIENERKQQPIDRPDPGKPIAPFQGDLVTAEDTQKAIEKELELRQARLASKQAEREENEARRNDLSQVTKGVQDLIAGNDNALKSFNASAENIVKGVVAAAGKGAETLDKMGESFAAVGSKAPEVKDVLATLATTLSKIEDPALRSKVALVALGGAGQSFLSAIDSGNVEKFTANLDKMGGRVTEADKKISGDLKAALTGLNADLSTIGTSIASAFGPGLTAAITKFDEFLSRRSEVKGFSEAIASGLGSTISALTSGFVKLAETISGTFDLIGRFGKAIEDLKHGAGFKTIKEDAKSLYDTLVAIDKVSGSNDERSKEGAEELTALRKKEYDQDKKHEEDQGKKQQEDKSRPTLPESSIRAAEDAENARRAASGQPPLEPVDRSAPPPAEKKPPGFLPGANENGFLPGVETIRAIIEELKNIGKRSGEQKKSEGEGGDLQKTADLGTALESLIQSIGALTTKLPDKETAPAGGGIRGEGDDAKDKAAQATTKMANAAEGATTPLDGVKTSSEGASPALDSLKTSAEAAAQALASVKAPPNAPGNDNRSDEAVAVAEGGHIRGPGTATSDSIPAMLSDGEYVIKKSAVDQIGVSALDAINSGRVHFAEGGAATIAALKKRLEELNGVEIKPRDITPKDASGDVVGKAVDSAKAADKKNTSSSSGSGGDGEAGGDPDHYDAYTGGHVDQTVLDSLNAASEAEGEADKNFIPIIYHNGSGGGGGGTKRKRHAEGGLIGDVANALNSIKLPRFADGGHVNFAPNLPRFADGGMVSISPRLPRFADGGAVGSDDWGGGGSMPHLGSVDLTTNYGSVRVMADRGGLSQLKKASVQRNLGTSPKPSWTK